ncbi:MAG: tRNA adenosine(34) deaminase TadA [Oscillospiraceae bacterium]|nr:tRNA adenosine(34) deaminase TadA [Oscillospiraceae bacterium]
MDEIFMREALKEAAKAAKKGETPVGAVIVRDGKIIARAHNLREKKKNALQHAEVLAINKACKLLGGWRLIGCSLYVTLEPCPMCAGAIINSRIERVVFGASDKKAGSCGSVVNLFELPYNHKPKVISGVLEENCGSILTEFFKALRRNKK